MVRDAPSALLTMRRKAVQVSDEKTYALAANFSTLLAGATNFFGFGT
jgi:hypothetical protein